MDFDKLLADLVALSDKHKLMIWEYIDYSALSAMTIDMVGTAMRKNTPIDYISSDIIHLWYPSLALYIDTKDHTYLDLDLDIEMIIRRAKYPTEERSDIEDECERCGRKSHVSNECYARRTVDGEYIEELSSDDDQGLVDIGI